MDFELRTEGRAAIAGRFRLAGAPVKPEAGRLPPLPSRDGRQAEASCVLWGQHGRTFLRWDGLWIERGMESVTPDRVGTYGTDRQFDDLLDLGGVSGVQYLGPVVRVRVRREIVEVRQPPGYSGSPFGNAVCEVQGQVKPPRRLRPMGTSLAERLRRDNVGHASVKVRYVVRRDGKVWDVLSVEGLRAEYRPLLEEDLRRMLFGAATLDGHPVASYQTEVLRF